MTLRLYHYWRSSSSWRVRWALDYKNISYQKVAINLLNQESESDSHLERNPSAQVPTLEFLSAAPIRFLSESVAIIEWLESSHPEPALLPTDPYLRARCRELTEMINSGTQPLQNLGVAQHHSPQIDEQKAWNQYWIRSGLRNYEAVVGESAGRLSLGDQLSAADLFLIPQCYNAIRFNIPLSEFPTIQRIHDYAMALPSCVSSHPDQYAPVSP